FVTSLTRYPLSLPGCRLKRISIELTMLQIADRRVLIAVICRNRFRSRSNKTLIDGRKTNEVSICDSSVNDADLADRGCRRSSGRSLHWTRQGLGYHGQGRSDNRRPRP